MEGTKHLQKTAPAIGLALLVLAGPLPVWAHHTLKQREEALRYREKYLELTDRIAPTFTLKDVADRTVGLEDFRGRIVILNFVFATCTDVCPLHSELIAELQRKMSAVRDKVQFITSQRIRSSIRPRSSNPTVSSTASTPLDVPDQRSRATDGDA